MMPDIDDVSHKWILVLNESQYPICDAIQFEVNRTSEGHREGETFFVGAPGRTLLYINSLRRRNNGYSFS